MRQYNWNDLRFFLSVARTGRITVAARRLGMDHATVSRRISALEHALKAQLFIRQPRGYLLTEHGEKLLRWAEQMEALALSAEGDVAGSTLELSGIVRIGAPDGFGSMFLAPRLGHLCDQYPDLDVQLIATSHVFSLSKREADVAITLAEPSSGRVRAQKLTDYYLGLYASPDYLAKRPEIKKTSDLQDHRFIGYIDDLLFTPELDYIPQISETLRSQLTSTNLIAQLEATAAGIGICVLPDFIGRHRPDIVPVLPKSVQLMRSFWLMTHIDSWELSRIRKTVSFISEQVNQNLPLFQEKYTGDA